MSEIQEVPVARESLDRFRPLLGEDAVNRAREAAGRLRESLDGRVVWNVNSTAVGGGVAEMLRPLVGYARGEGVDVRWCVISGSDDFFQLTKRIHHALHGSRGDGLELGAEARRTYESSLRAQSTALCSSVAAGDVVILHDPQTAGMAPALLRHGARVVWRCHVGHDEPGPDVDAGWQFLEPYLRDVPAHVFSRRAYAPSWCPEEKVAIIPPSIDAFSPKNQDLSDDGVEAMLVHAGLVEGPPSSPDGLGFLRADGTPGRLDGQAEVLRSGRPPALSTPLVVRISRWDPLKDHAGVMEGFATTCDGDLPCEAELLLVGPDVRGVSDDPEGPAVFEDVHERWRRLPSAVRKRVHLAMLPVDDVDENGVLVNAIQRHATVVVQKSLHEGFGLTVTEAMWKSRAVLASAVGGIRDQISDGVSGELLPRPDDLGDFSSRLARLLDDPDRRSRLGRGAREVVLDRYLPVRHLLDYAALLDRVGS